MGDRAYKISEREKQNLRFEAKQSSTKRRRVEEFSRKNKKT
jgi:hypothetical protein